MRSFLRLLLPTVTVGVAVAALAYTVVGCAHDPAGASWQLAEALRQFETGRRVGETLDTKSAAIREWSAAKHEVVAALAEGQLTLPEAAAEFRRLDANISEVQQLPSFDDFPGKTEGERYCRNVIVFAYASLYSPEQPEHADALRTRLEAELQEHLDHHGVVVLPDSAGRGDRSRTAKSASTSGK